MVAGFVQTAQHMHRVAGADQHIGGNTRRRRLMVHMHLAQTPTT